MLDIISIGLIALIALIAFREISKWLIAVFYMAQGEKGGQAQSE